MNSGWEVSQFCINKLHYKKGSYQTLQIFSKAKKSIQKFILKYRLDQEIKKNLRPPIKIEEIDKFYLQYPERLEKITNKKLNYLTPLQQKKKIIERPNNLPEENDRIFLLEAIRINESNSKDVYIFSNDSDFVKFREEIKKKFGVNILKIDDPIIED